MEVLLPALAKGDARTRKCPLAKPGASPSLSGAFREIRGKPWVPILMSKQALAGSDPQLIP